MIRQSIAIAIASAALLGVNSLGHATSSEIAGRSDSEGMPRQSAPASFQLALNPQPEPPGIFRFFQNLFIAPKMLRDPKTNNLIAVDRLPPGPCRTQSYLDAHSTACLSPALRQGINPQ